MAVAGRRGCLLVYFVNLCLLYVCVWHAEALPTPRLLARQWRQHQARERGQSRLGPTLPLQPILTSGLDVQPPPTIDTGREAILVEIIPTPVVQDKATVARRQVAIGGPTSTLTAGSGAPGVQIDTGDGSNNGTDSGEQGDGGGGLTKDQNIQLGVGIGLGLPGAIAGLIAIWHCVRKRGVGSKRG